MPKIFVLRDRLAEQQARLRANDKNGVAQAALASEDAAAGPSSQQQQQPLNLQSRPTQYAPKIGKSSLLSCMMSQTEH